MKKTLFILSIIVIFTGCEKESESNNDPIVQMVKELDINFFVRLIDSSVEQVKDTFNNVQLNETSILGKTRSIYFTKETEECIYDIFFEFNSEEKVTDINIYGEEYFNYSTGISFTKKLSDRIISLYPEVSYEGYCTPKTYQNQVEFWSYVTDNCIKDYSYTREEWRLGNIYLSLWFFLNKESSASITITNDNSFF